VQAGRPTVGFTYSDSWALVLICVYRARYYRGKRKFNCCAFC